jgi:hypothetical protein
MGNAGWQSFVSCVFLIGTINTVFNRCRRPDWSFQPARKIRDGDGSQEAGET